MNLKKLMETIKSNINPTYYKMGLILGVLVLIIIILLFIGSLSNKKGKKLSGGVENILITAAKKYITNNPNAKPTEIGDVLELGADKLDSYTGTLKNKSGNCTGMVRVVRSSKKDLLYLPKYNCPNDAKNIKIVSKITSNIVTNGIGLYSSNNTLYSYIFKGEDPDNYLRIKNDLFRILYIDRSDNIVLLKIEGNTSVSSAWDDSFNKRTKDKSGYNEYSISKIQNSLDKFMKNKIKYNNPNLMAYVISKDYCVGKRFDKSVSKDYREECDKKTTSDIGLLTVADFLNVSLDKNCRRLEDESCQNRNYLSRYSTWLSTANKKKTNEAYYLSRGLIMSRECREINNILPVFTIDGTSLYESGDGSRKKPYLIK